jgi:hypothetical protein
MSDNLKRTQLRALQYWIVDGVGELFVDFLFLLVAIIYYFQESTTGSLLSKVFSIIPVLVVCGGAFGGRRIMQRIKERTTYPRTGYLTNKSTWKNKRDFTIAIGLTAFVLVINVFIMVANTKLTDWGLVIGGVFMGILLVQVGYRSAFSRFNILAFLSLLIGAGIVVGGISILLSWPLFFSLNGLFFLSSGSLTLWKYLSQTPVHPRVAR